MAARKTLPYEGPTSMTVGINSVPMEVAPIARATAWDYYEAARGEPDLDSMHTDFEVQLYDACEAWQGEPDGSSKKRAALLRLAALATTLLVVDEHVRGEEQCAAIAATLDKLGFVKRAP